MTVLTENPPPLLIEVTIDDATQRPSSLRVANTTDTAFWVELIQSDGIGQGVVGRKYGARFAARSDTSISIPTGQGQRLQMALDGRGRWDGCDLQIYQVA